MVLRYNNIRLTLGSQTIERQQGVYYLPLGLLAAVVAQCYMIMNLWPFRFILKVLFCKIVIYKSGIS